MNYWQSRSLSSQEKISKKSIKQIEAQLKKQYKQAAKQCINDFEATYDKLVATVEAGKEITPADLYKLDKYWQLQGQLRKELQKLGDREIKILSEAFEANFFEVYYSLNLPGVETGQFNTLDTAAVQQLINQIWCADGKSWSQRIWQNNEKLMETLNEQLLHCVATGKKTTELKNLLQDRFGVSYSRANTLVRTEIAHIQTQAAKQRYQDYGLTEYEIFGNEDDNCGNHSIDCHEMDRKKFLYSEMVVGKNAPPFHPNCKCCIVPVID